MTPTAVRSFTDFTAVGLGDSFAILSPAANPPSKRKSPCRIGPGSNPEPLFRKLRPHGVYFSRVQPENGLKLLLDAVAARSKAHPLAHGHWYIDGGQETILRSHAFLTAR